MSETDSDSQSQKRRGRLFANASFVLAISGLVYTFFTLPMTVGFDQMAIGIFVCLAGIVSGIAALVKINELKGKLDECLTAILGIVICAGVASLLWTGFYSRRELDYRVICTVNLHELGNTMRVYRDEHDAKYPTADKWCDLLLQGDYESPKQFVCKAAESQGDTGRCHYAMNPNCEPNSPPDMVLLFETKGGWNQFGGPEIMNTKIHKIHEAKGCNILFNDGSIRFIQADRLDTLKWRVEEDEP